MVSHSEKVTKKIPESQKTDQIAPSNEAILSEKQVIDQLQEELAQAKEQVLRALADLENQRRRAAEEIQNAHKYASTKFATDLLSVKDALEMALADQSGQFDTLKIGVELTLKAFMAAFDRAQISEINPQEGDLMDPHRHHAIRTEEVADAESNKIVRVMQKGYCISDRVLRPAMVVVSVKAESKNTLEKVKDSHDLST